MTVLKDTPMIIGFAKDLFFTTKIENVARHLNFQMMWVESAGQFGVDDPQAPANQAAEPVYGRTARLIDQLTEWQPALLIFDLGNEDIPWRQWIAVIKSSPATRRLPILCYGSHVDVATMNAARAAGANEVVARSRFTSAMPELITKLARVPDHEAQAITCQEPLSELAVQGIEAFNHGDYYEAHERLEDAWNEDKGIGRDLYRAILQVAVAYLQIERGNYAGAIKMFLRARQWFEPLPAVCRGVDLGQLQSQAHIVHEALLAAGPDGLAAFDHSLFQPVHYRHDAADVGSESGRQE